MSKVLITGGTGFVGQHLSRLLLATNPGIELHLTTYSKQPEPISPELEHVALHNLDLTDFNATTQLIEQIKPDQIYHLAAIAVVGQSFAKADLILENNIKLQLNLFKAIIEKKIRPKILIVSSAEIYGLCRPEDLPIAETHPFRPANPYAVSKATQELLAIAYAQNYAMEIVCVRPFNHTGEGQSTDFVIPAFARQIVAVEKGLLDSIKVGNLQSRRDFSDVKDIVRGYELLMKKGKSGEVYNIGSGKAVQIQTVLDELLALSSVKVRVETDAQLMRTTDLPAMMADINKISQLGWRPEIELKQTLQRVIADWRQKI